MTFRQRLPYFLGGLTIGIIAVAFFLDKKNTTFDYGPNARVLKNIRIKNLVYSSEATTILNTKNIDSAKVAQILQNGNVDIFNKIKLDSCLYEYNITGKKELKNITLTITNCDSTAVVKKITID